MELGSLDLGSVSLSNETEKNDESLESQTCETTNSSSSIVRSKSKSPKGSPPKALNRFSSQIKKPPHRKTSPISWFPRKKVDSYLNRKIKLLQEAGGMNDTLGETLGHSNPHYCRVEREKMAAKEAARKVMNARKAAMVEASWCRILQAARIPSKEAEALLLKAEEEVKEAVEGAIAKGVIMYDTPDHPLKHFEIETSSVSGKGSTTHTVKAAFETAFEVDKQVASAVKTAFIRLAHCSSFNRDEFKDLLRKISENPDNQELSESDNGSEFEAEHKDDTCNSQGKQRKKSSPQKFNGTMLVDMMLERLKCLKEDELASLATIVATCGLNAALANTENHNRAREKVEQELPSLDKFLVKKMTKLEREVQEARNARKGHSENPQMGNDKPDEKPVSTVIPDLGSSLVKRSSKFEKEIEEAKRNQNMTRVQKHGKSWKQAKEEEVPSLDKVLVKHVSRLEREVQEAKNRRRDEQTEKENVDSNGKEQGRKSNGGSECGGLDEVLVKHVSRLEREVQEAKNRRRDEQTEKENVDSNGKEQGRKSNGGSECGGLDEVLVKHVSKLEKEKMGIGKERLEMKKKDATSKLDTSVGGGGLDQILVKHKSRLEREKTNASQQQQQQPDTDGVSHSIVSRRQARERELLEMWGGVGLGNSIQPKVSRLERDKAAWLKAEEEERRTVLQEQ